LRTLSVEAYQPKLFDENLTREEADRRIEALRPRNCAGQLLLSQAAIGRATIKPPFMPSGQLSATRWS
jgi:hypothetical protein